MPIPTYQDVLSAAARIKPYVHYTPVLTSKALDRMSGASLHFKCENFQKVGAFKARGGCNAVFSLTTEQARNGVATHSSGNHAQAVAYAASLRGIPATIVMPENAPPVKVAAVREYGAHIVWAGSHPMDREKRLQEVLEQTGSHFIHPSNDEYVIAGAGTAALECISQVPDLDIIMVPVGGGGLLSGTALSVSGIRGDNCQTYAAEPAIADDAFRSWRDGIIYPPTNAGTIADGLRTFLGDVNFPIIRQYVHEIITVSEKSIIDAMRLVWERMKILIEPSSAVPVAALFEQPKLFVGKRVAIILSGGNVDLEKLPWQQYRNDLM
ncbi:MAG: pyridoxal-phosphate dependent enzyme [Anaerolineae bacterium]|nr:pyridoxal-phosphate dependent enzyme [Anaerolineae bacterium]